MTIRRRLGLYLIGFLFGLILSWNLLDRFPNWLPGDIVIDKLRNSKLHFAPSIQCRIKCFQLSEFEIKELLIDGEINFNKSDVHREPCPEYALENTVSNGKKFRVWFESCDSICTVMKIIPLSSNDQCDCVE